MSETEPYARVFGPGQLDAEDRARSIKQVLLSQIGACYNVKAADPYKEFPRGDVQANYLVAVFDSEDNWLGTASAVNALSAARFIDEKISTFLQSENDKA